MTLTITINTDGAAFDEDPTAEVQRILQEVSRRVAEEGDDFSVLDINGNTACTVSLEVEE